MVEIIGLSNVSDRRKTVRSFYGQNEESETWVIAGKMVTKSECILIPSHDMPLVVGCGGQIKMLQ